MSRITSRRRRMKGNEGSGIAGDDSMRWQLYLRSRRSSAYGVVPFAATIETRIDSGAMLVADGSPY